MMISLRPKKASRLLPTDILFQTVFWGQVKARLGWNPMAFDFVTPGGIYDVLVLNREIAPGILAAYVPQGPEYAPESDGYGSFLENLSVAMTPYLDPEVAFIRYDLPWESSYAADLVCRDGQREWSGHPEARLRELRMNFGTTNWNLRKAVTDLTVADTLILDLNRNEGEILKSMKPKTRYNIHLAERNGTRVFFASPELLPAFYRLYEETAGRKRFPVCSYECFSALFIGYDSNQDSSAVHFLLATHGKNILSGAIIAVSGHRATYLFGASANHNRNLMGSYAVQWAAIRFAHTSGCLSYDMGAVSPTADPGHPFYGLYRFKTGFGGNITHRNGSWDYPLDTDAYRTLRNSEIVTRNLQ
jgi:lipid II:glycine glycyltransferase (peptidoglycan interpeptide bridge formation enzyme)